MDADSTWRIVLADYGNAAHGRAIVALLDEYAIGPSGGGEALPAQVKTKLISVLRNSPCALTLLAFAGEVPIGLLNAFETVSTFRAKPLLNVHDIAVTAGWRRRGVARALMQEIEAVARKRGCCKLTLEVLEHNTAAQALYLELGFEEYQLQKDFGRALFWQKRLSVRR